MGTIAVGGDAHSVGIGLVVRCRHHELGAPLVGGRHLAEHHVGTAGGVGHAVVAVAAEEGDAFAVAGGD